MLSLLSARQRRPPFICLHTTPLRPSRCVCCMLYRCLFSPPLTQPFHCLYSPSRFSYRVSLASLTRLIVENQPQSLPVSKPFVLFFAKPHRTTHILIHPSFVPQSPSLCHSLLANRQSVFISPGFIRTPSTPWQNCNPYPPYNYRLSF